MLTHVPEQNKYKPFVRLIQIGFYAHETHIYTHERSNTMDNGTQMYMPVAPAYGAGNGMGGFGYGGDWWLILILLFAFGGWGGGFGGWGGNSFAADGAMLYPWMNQAEITSNGFQNQATNSAINSLQNSVTAGFGDVQLGIAGINQNICQTGSGITQAVNNGFAQAEIANNTRQIANLQQAFANQTAMNQGFSNLQTQFATCCCDNRAGLADLKYTVATEACADRSAVNDALRDVLAANTASTQRILDQMCQDKIDAKNEKIVELQNQLTMAELRANNNQQTQTLLTDNLAQTNALEQYLAPVPRPAYIVQNPNCCTNTCAYNCGCGVG